MLHIHMCTERGGPFVAGRALGGHFTKPPSIIFYTWNTFLPLSMGPKPVGHPPSGPFVVV